jgi:hypothetical protein
MARTIGYLVTEARQLLNDEVPISGLPRYPDADLMTAVNDAINQVRTKRPDAFLRYGLRREIPLYAYPVDQDTSLPFDDMFYPAVLFYVVGRSELTEDTFADDNRAVALMGKFSQQLLTVAG